MRPLLLILLMPVFLFSQEEEPLSYHIGVYGGLTQSRSTGPNGFEKSLYYSDLIHDFTEKGHTASGGLFPRYSMNFGAFYAHYFSNQFTLESSLGMEKKGYKEDLVFDYAQGDTIQNYLSKATVSLTYLDWMIGIKYFNKYGWTIHAGGIYSMNLIDKVHHQYSNNLTIGDSTIISESHNKTVFFHEHYGFNREIYTPGYYLGFGYKYSRFEMEFLFKQQYGVYYEDKRDQNIFTLNARFRIYIVE